MRKKLRFPIRAKLALLSAITIGVAVSTLGIFLSLTFSNVAQQSAKNSLENVTNNAWLSLENSIDSVETSMNLLANQIGYNTDFANSIEKVEVDEEANKKVRTALSGSGISGDGSTIIGAMDYLLVSDSTIKTANMYSPYVDKPILSRLFNVRDSKIEFTEEKYDLLLKHPGTSLWFFTTNDGVEELYVWKALINFGVTDNFDMKVVGFVEYSFDRKAFLSAVTDTQYTNEGMVLQDANGNVVLSLGSGLEEVDKEVFSKINELEVGTTNKGNFTAKKVVDGKKGWTYTTFINHKAIDQIKSEGTLTTVIIVLVSAILASLVAVLLSAREIKRIKEASKAAQDISGGNYSTRLPLKGNDELTDQAQSINTMGENIQNLIGELRELNKTLVLQSDSLTENFATVVSNKSGESGYHVRRVSTYSEILAETLGFDEEKVHTIKVASTLHDIGKILIPDNVLHKPGRFNDEERKIMQDHVVFGAQILNDVPGDIMETGAKIALYHHERWDGKGYVHGLKGDEIPIEAQITSVADVFDALISRRCYKEPWSIEDAYNEIVNNSGTQFSPRVVEAFIKSYDRIKETALMYLEKEKAEGHN